MAPGFHSVSDSCALRFLAVLVGAGRGHGAVDLNLKQIWHLYKPGGVSKPHKANADAKFKVKSNLTG